MSVLKEKERRQIGELLAGMAHPVRLVLFKQEAECQYDEATHDMGRELVSLSNRLSLEVFDLARDAGAARSFCVDKTPALVVAGERDHGIRFYGVPVGYEFTTLVEAILDVGGRGHGLAAPVLALLARVDRPVRMQVFVTPGCPYCPRAVRTAHRFALASELITAEMVEASEFPVLAAKYQVRGVPHTIINEEHGLAGAQPELALAQAILRAIGKD